MPSLPRVLDAEPVASLKDYLDGGGGRGLSAARKLGPAAVIDDVDASGLRGRGGAGFPTGTKWRTVAENSSPDVPATVVVNAAEGEPGTFKDRSIVRANPYRVLEGAVVAASAVGARRVVIALKSTFERERARLEAALAEVTEAGWAEDLDLTLVGGPSEYLFGEETALLEVIDGRKPFPRIAPPFRQGVELAKAGKSPARVAMAGPEEATVAAPTLVNNAETMANVAAILAEGPSWFRSVGTAESPGTVVCTISGSTQRAGVGEYPLGTPLAEVIEEVGGGMAPGRKVLAVMSGVANALLPGTLVTTPLTYEDMTSAGSGLGAAGFIVFDDETDLAAVAQGVSRFLAVESCGQCTPCKQDGMALAELLHSVCRSEASEADVASVQDHLRTVANEARCYLAQQHELVVGSILEHFPEALLAHVSGGLAAVAPELIAPILDIEDGRAVLDEKHRDKQPDWTFDAVYSGQSPADRLDEDLPKTSEGPALE